MNIKAHRCSTLKTVLHLLQSDVVLFIAPQSRHVIAEWTEELVNEGFFKLKG